MASLLTTHPYTATDDAAGATAASLATWRVTRAMFSTFVGAEYSAQPGRFGSAYARYGRELVYPTLVLTDDQGRSLALNGVSFGYEGQGPSGAAHILSTEGLLDEATARDTVTQTTHGTIQRPQAVAT